MTVRHISDDMSKRINTVSISNFFKKRPKQSDVTSTSQPEPEATQEDRNPPGPSQTATAPTHSSSAAVSTANENPIYDISQVLNRQTISTADKHFILTHSFDPPANFNWPYEERLSKSKTERRYLRPEHLQKNAFLALSREHGGLYCKVCLVFADIDQICQKAGVNEIFLLNKPLKKFSRLFGKDGYVSSHEVTIYHIESTRKSIDFLTSYKHPESAIDVQLDSQVKSEIERKFSPVQKILETPLL